MLAAQWADGERWLVLGRGYHLATVLEMALKLQEMSGVLAQGYSVADFRHGPIAVVDGRTRVLIVAGGGPAAPLLGEAMDTIQERGGLPIVLGDGPGLAPEAALWLPVPLPEPLRPLPTLVAGRLFAYFLAVARGVDPSAPPGLRKVTVTR